MSDDRYYMTSVCFQELANEDILDVQKDGLKAPMQSINPDFVPLVKPKIWS